MHIHSIAIRNGYQGNVQNRARFPFHIGNYECKCGIRYGIFADPLHVGLGEQFGKYIEQQLGDIHGHDQKHPDVINLPMDAEFMT